MLLVLVKWGFWWEGGELGFCKGFSEVAHGVRVVRRNWTNLDAERRQQQAGGLDVEGQCEITGIGWRLACRLTAESIWQIEQNRRVFCSGWRHSLNEGAFEMSKILVAA